jgi:integral membrane protein (TIGR01906 family)
MNRDCEEFAAPVAGELRLNSDTSGHADEKRSRTGMIARRAVVAVSSGLFVIALPAALIFGAVRFAFSWQPVYTYAITAYHADEVTGISTSELLRATHVIRNYFTNGRRDLGIDVIDNSGESVPLFNTREIAHMRDVKTLVHRFYLLLDAAALYVGGFALLTLLFRRDGPRRLAQALLGGSLVTVALLLVIGGASLVGFDQLFLWFHMLSFSNSFWELDPTRDHLI